MPKKTIAIITGVVVVAAVAAVFVVRPKQTPQKEKGLADVQRNLTQDQEKIYTDRITFAENYLHSLQPAQPTYRQEQGNVYVNLANQYYGLGKLQKSKEYYEKALEAVPYLEPALVGLSLVLIDGSDIEGAKNILEQALESNPRNADVWVRYIQLRKSIGATNEELDRVYQEARTKTENHVDVATQYAAFLESSGRPADALSLWKQLSQQFPKNESYRQEIKRLEQVKK